MSVREGPRHWARRKCHGSATRLEYTRSIRTHAVLGVRHEHEGGGSAVGVGADETAAAIVATWSKQPKIAPYRSILPIGTWQHKASGPSPPAHKAAAALRCALRWGTVDGHQSAQASGRSRLAVTAVLWLNRFRIGLAVTEGNTTRRCTRGAARRTSTGRDARWSPSGVNVSSARMAFSACQRTHHCVCPPAAGMPIRLSLPVSTLPSHTGGTQPGTAELHALQPLPTPHLTPSGMSYFAWVHATVHAPEAARRPRRQPRGAAG